MNKVLLCGRLTAEPTVNYSNGANGQMAIARYTLAVGRRIKSDNEANADFISCVAFGKNGEFAEKYLHKGTKILVEGRINTGSYTDKNGNKVYTTNVVVDGHEFVESKNSNGNAPAPKTDADGFMDIPNGIDEELPFN